MSLGGIWGTLAIGLFAKYDDAFQAETTPDFRRRRIRSNRYASGSGHHRCCRTIVTGFIMFGALKRSMGLRVSPEEENAG